MKISWSFFLLDGDFIKGSRFNPGIKRIKKTDIQLRNLQEFSHGFSVLHPPITQIVFPTHFKYDLYKSLKRSRRPYKHVQHFILKYFITIILISVNIEKYVLSAGQRSHR